MSCCLWPPDFWGLAPLGNSGVHRIILCPSILSALRRSVCQPCQCLCLQRALLSVVSARKTKQSWEARRPLGVPRAAGLVSCQSSASGHRASSSRHTRGQFWKTGSLSRGFMRFALVAKHTIIIFTLTASVVGLLTAESFWGLRLLELCWDSLWVVGPRWASLKNPCVWSIVGIPSIQRVVMLRPPFLEPDCFGECR